MTATAPRPGPLGLGTGAARTGSRGRRMVAPAVTIGGLAPPRSRSTCATRTSTGRGACARAPRWASTAPGAVACAPSTT